MTPNASQAADGAAGPDETGYVEGRIGYMSRTAGSGLVHVDRAKQSGFAREERLCRIYDAWPHRESLSIDRQGFVAVKHQTRFGDERDLGALQAGYPDELTDLIQSLSGAAWVLPKRVDLVLRASTPGAGREMTAGAAHADYTPKSVREQGDIVLAANGQAGRPYRRVGVYQTWRALTPPPQDRPLALCDARTILEEDRLPFANVIGREDDPTKVFETTLARSSPNHRWCYFPNMQLDDLLVFRGADTDPQMNLNIFHTGFLDPTPGPAAVSRESVESRFFCFYD